MVGEEEKGKKEQKKEKEQKQQKNTERWEKIAKDEQLQKWLATPEVPLLGSG